MNVLSQMDKIITEKTFVSSPGPVNDPDSSSNIHTLVAMPAYNEEKFIAKTVVGAKRYADAVLVVDDGSQDETVEIARALGAIVVQHQENQGYGGALKTIFSTARRLGVEELVILDSDGQHNSGDIPILLDALKGGNDVVIGSRFIEGMDSHIPVYRVVGMKILDSATKLAGNIEVTDSQSGFRAYGKRAIEVIRPNGNGMSVGSEILFLIGEYHLRVAEVPVRVRYDIEETSSQNPISHGFSVLGNIITFVGYRKPIWFFGVPGFASIAFGLVAGYLAFSDYYINGKFPYPVSIVCVLTLIMGMLLITSGLILNFLVNIVGMLGNEEEENVAER